VWPADIHFLGDFLAWLIRRIAVGISGQHFYRMRVNEMLSVLVFHRKGVIAFVAP
jgi:hypothetical protein